MNQFLEWLSRLFSSWKFWVVVPPWDIGVRVRLGKTAQALQPGPHFRIPFLDEVILVNTRLRITSAPPVTIQNGSLGRARIISAVVGYKVHDPVKALKHFASPDPAVVSLAAASIAKLRDVDQCQKDLALGLLNTGVQVEFVRYLEDVDGVRTFRLLQGQSSIYGGEGVAPTMPGATTSRY